MNEQTTKLVEQLAQKLGTTSEYLWGVLLKQAPVEATITIVQILFIALFGLALYRLHKHFSNDDNEMSYHNSEATFGLMIAGFIVFGVLAVASLFSINEIINGYFNPEFWALNYILESLK